MLIPRCNKTVHLWGRLINTTLHRIGFPRKLLRRWAMGNSTKLCAKNNHFSIRRVAQQRSRQSCFLARMRGTCEILFSGQVTGIPAKKRFSQKYVSALRQLLFEVAFWPRKSVGTHNGDVRAGNMDVLAFPCCGPCSPGRGGFRISHTSARASPKFPPLPFDTTSPALLNHIRRWNRAAMFSIGPSQS